MTKKDYKAIALAVRDSTNEEGLIKSAPFVLRLCDIFQVDNERFDSNRFIKACEVSGG